jgi:GNAT superfamily N-acetyltransferase
MAEDERRVPTLISVDLDDVACYHAIHGLPPPSEEQRGLVLERCLPRYLELFEELDVRATFFVIGRDLERDLAGAGVGARLLQEALRRGHELGNHSYAHAYDLAKQPGLKIFEDIHRCDCLLRSIGARPRGFRAPGYTHNRKLLEQVSALGYRYDSSRLPSPIYYLAKLGAISWMTARGAETVAMRRGWQSFIGPSRPHYMPKVGLWEVPISVSPGLRLPMIGTFLLSGPQALATQAAIRGFLHLELHGIDLADPGSESQPGDGYDRALCKKQPELRRSLESRRERLRALLKARRGGTSIGAAFGAV